MEKKGFNGLLVKNLDLKSISSFRIGGRARHYFVPEDLRSLTDFIKQAKTCKNKYYIIGNCSNILFSDKIYPGTIISLKGFTNFIQPEKNTLVCGAAVPLQTVIDFAVSAGLKGLETLSGIPGTMGGALVMNAGAFGTEIGGRVEWVKVLTRSGQVKKIPRKRIGFSYRKAKGLENTIVLEAALKLSRGDRRLLAGKMKEALRQRKEKQPWQYPSCGSVFKRPLGNYAGTLIERSGLKGLRVNKAEVSQKHANFIINRGGAKASDVLRLIKLVQKKVLEDSGVKLEPEIKFFNFPRHAGAQAGKHSK